MNQHQCERSNIIADWARRAMCRRPIKTAPLAFALCRQKPIDSNHLPEFWFFVSFRLEAMWGCVYCTQWEISAAVFAATIKGRIDFEVINMLLYDIHAFFKNHWNSYIITHVLCSKFSKSWLPIVGCAETLP